MAPAPNTNRRPFNTRGRGRGRGRPRIHGRGGALMGSRASFGTTQANGVEKSPLSGRRGRGNKALNNDRRTAGLTFIRDVNAILGDPSAPGYKPREERSYTEFHPDLGVGMVLRVMSAEEVDGDNYQPPALPTIQTVTASSNDTGPLKSQDAAHTVLPIRTTSDPLQRPPGDDRCSRPKGESGIEG